MYIKRIGLFALTGLLFTSCGTLWSDPVIITKTTNEYGVPVFWAKSSSFRAGYAPLVGRAAVRTAVRIGNDLIETDESVPFRTADIRGKLRRVNVDGTDVAVIDNVRMPFFGTRYTKRELKKRVAAKATVQTGCKRLEGMFVQVQSAADITGYAVPLLCEAGTVKHADSKPLPVPIKNADTHSQKFPIKKTSN